MYINHATLFAVSACSTALPCSCNYNSYNTNHATLPSVSACSTDDSDLMSAPVDLPREEAEVFFSQEKLHQDEPAPGAHVDNPTGGRATTVGCACAGERRHAERHLLHLTDDSSDMYRGQLHVEVRRMGMCEGRSHLERQQNACKAAKRQEPRHVMLYYGSCTTNSVQCIAALLHCLVRHCCCFVLTRELVLY
jgi:hypothetical protein